MEKRLQAGGDCGNLPGSPKPVRVSGAGLDHRGNLRQPEPIPNRLKTDLEFVPDPF